MVNRAAVNTETINAIVPDVVQRTIMVSHAAAYCSVKMLRLSRGPVTCSAKSKAATVIRSIIRSPVSCSAKSSAVVTAAVRIKYPVTCRSRAIASAGYTIYPRESYSSPVRSESRAVVYAHPKYLIRGPVSCRQYISVSVDSSHVFAYSRSAVIAHAGSVIAVDGEVFKRIPYDLDAPDERSMQVSEESRVMTCQ